MPGKHSPCHNNTSSSLNCWHKRVWVHEFKFWSYHLHVTVQIKIHSTRWYFSNLQPFSLGEPVPFVQSDSCTWLTGVEPDNVPTFLKSTTLFWSLLRPTFRAYSRCWMETSLSVKECCMPFLHCPDDSRLTFWVKLWFPPKIKLNIQWPCRVEWRRACWMLLCSVPTLLYYLDLMALFPSSDQLFIWLGGKTGPMGDGR